MKLMNLVYNLDHARLGLLDLSCPSIGQELQRRMVPVLLVHLLAAH